MLISDHGKRNKRERERERERARGKVAVPSLLVAHERKEYLHTARFTKDTRILWNVVE